MKSPRDKMIRNRDQHTKRANKPASKKARKHYYFPHYGRSVQADSEEEAIRIISQIK